MADKDLRILRVNNQFQKFFPILQDVKNAYFPNILKQIGVPKSQIQEFEEMLLTDGRVLIPRIKLTINGEEKLYAVVNQNISNKYLNF